MSDQAAEMTEVSSFWNDGGGRAWVAAQSLLDRLYQPISDVLTEAAGAGPSVLDVGCGAGATTLAMARRLGVEGRCVGVDISAPLLELARRRAGAEGLRGAEFIEADAQTWNAGAGAFDSVISRFGVMFFADPEAAFANLRRATCPGGRLVFASWRGPADNPLAELPLAAALPFLSRPPAPPPADAPGRWAFADPDRVRTILEGAGWRRIEITPLDTPSPVSFDEAVGISLNLGSLGPLLRQETDAVRAKVQAAVAERLRAEAVGGLVPMTSACWLVSASN